MSKSVYDVTLKEWSNQHKISSMASVINLMATITGWYFPPFDDYDAAARIFSQCSSTYRDLATNGDGYLQELASVQASRFGFYYAKGNADW